MADRYPLIVDSSSSLIKELPAGDALIFADNDKIKIGTGTDLTLYHDATNSYITNAVGALKVATETSGIAVTIGHTTSETTVADNLTVTGDFSVGGAFDVTGTLDFSDSDITNAGDIQLDSITGDGDTNTSITFSGSDVITIATGGSGRLTIGDGALSPVTDSQIDLGTSVLEFKDAYFDGTVTSDAFAGPLTGAVTGNADTATTLATARTIGGVSFDGSANIAVTLAATATALATGRTIGGTSFDGTANIVPGTATVATTVTITDNESTDEDNAIIFTAGGDVDGGNLGLESDGNLTYNPSTGTLTATEVSATTLDIGGTNLSATATELNYVDGVTSSIQTQLDAGASTGKAIAMAIVFG